MEVKWAIRFKSKGENLGGNKNVRTFSVVQVDS